MIKYIVQPKKNPHTGNVKYYAQVAPTTPVDYNQIAEEIEKITSLSNGDISNCLKSLEYVIRQHLLAGESVRFGDLGSFRPTLTSEGSSTAAEVSADNIKEVRIRFRAGAWLTSRTTRSTSGVSFAQYQNAEGGKDASSSTSD